MSEKSIVIIGAGIAGLTLAYKLLESGVNHPVVLVEKEDRALSMDVLEKVRSEVSKLLYN